jgi:hypothetical protein
MPLIAFPMFRLEAPRMTSSPPHRTMTSDTARPGSCRSGWSLSSCCGTSASRAPDRATFVISAFASAMPMRPATDRRGCELPAPTAVLSPAITTRSLARGGR